METRRGARCAGLPRAHHASAARGPAEFALRLRPRPGARVDRRVPDRVPGLRGSAGGADLRAARELPADRVHRLRRALLVDRARLPGLPVGGPLAEPTAPADRRLRLDAPRRRPRAVRGDEVLHARRPYVQHALSPR